MTVKMTWIVPNRVIHTRASGVFTSDDLQTIKDRSFEMTKMGQPLVHNIIDGTDVTELEIDVGDVYTIMKDGAPFSEKRGWSVVITPSSLLRFMGGMASQFSRIRYRQFKSLEAGIQFLAENDPTLPTYEEMMQAVNVAQINVPAEPSANQ